MDIIAAQTIQDSTWRGSGSRKDNWLSDCRIITYLGFLAKTIEVKNSYNSCASASFFSQLLSKWSMVNLTLIDDLVK